MYCKYFVRSIVLFSKFFFVRKKNRPNFFSRNVVRTLNYLISSLSPVKIQITRSCIHTHLFQNSRYQCSSWKPLRATDSSIEHLFAQFSVTGSFVASLGLKTGTCSSNIMGYCHVETSVLASLARSHCDSNGLWSQWPAASLCVTWPLLVRFQEKNGKRRRWDCWDALF